MATVLQGKAQAAEQLLPHRYDELRKLAAAWIAAKAPDNTRNATGLLHETLQHLEDKKSSQGGTCDGAVFWPPGARRSTVLVRVGEAGQHGTDAGVWLLAIETSEEKS